ncbi:hypothetical protein AAU01_09350 [Paenarthrobacter aurescens]|uniref:Uncharacterized protein n=2 Tax=Paenarthrobacter aurescens TaxID=43663 RepID=A0A4Y3N8M4_PAEAU|nr:hypothetical protein AAU01_09350 [Paenarthrobacter aurescens]
MVGILNTSHPDLSTYFRPGGQSVNEYLENKVADVADFGVKEVSEKEVQDINKSVSVDHAANYHQGPQISGPTLERGVSSELSQADSLSEPALER